MKYLFTLLISALLIGLQGQSIADRLKNIAADRGFSVEQLKADSLFKEKYLLVFNQPVDHNQAGGPAFQQRVILSHLGTERPVVFVTEGYMANYALNSKYVNELASYFEANQLVVEHRYFGASAPDSLNWSQLTVANAAADHHKVVEALKEIYTAKWIGTGISKGGQTAMYHRCFYPGDVDVTVAYVAPLNFSIEDKRVYRFLDTVSSTECRSRILEFQQELLSNKPLYLPAFEQRASREGLTFRIGMEKAFELTVLEYPFAFFQWGSFNCENIPLPLGPPDLVIEHLDKVSGLSWVSDQSVEAMQPFFYQAMAEIGFYGYDIRPFRKWVTFSTNPTFTFTLPEGVQVDFQDETMKKVDRFIRHHARHMLFIYGGRDPWSATAVNLSGNANCVKVVKAGGSHSTRISNLPADQQRMVLELLHEWLEDGDQ